MRCDDLKLLHDFVAYKQTAVFDANSVAAGLTSSYSTKAAVWAKIYVLEGRLSYEIAEPISKEFVLDPAFIGVVTPEILHHVLPHPFCTSVDFKKKKEVVTISSVLIDLAELLRVNLLYTIDHPRIELGY